MTVQTMEQTKKEIEARPKQALAGAESTRPERLFSPAVDIFESEEAITILADMPGVSPEGLSVDLRDNVLTIDGRVAGNDEPNERTLLREFETGAFRREFRLTNLIDQNRIDASLHNGVLRLTLPKAEAARPRKIDVRAG